MPDLLTLDEAREVARRAVVSRWHLSLGTLHVHEQAHDFGTYWRMNVGAAEFIVDGDEDFRLLDAPVVLVNKATGHVTVVPWFDDPLLTASGPVPPLTPAPPRP